MVTAKLRFQSLRSLKIYVVSIYSQFQNIHSLKINTASISMIIKLYAKQTVAVLPYPEQLRRGLAWSHIPNANLTNKD